MAKTLRHPTFGTRIPFGRLSDMEIPHPERTASKAAIDITGDVTFQEWPNRPSMLTSLRMQDRGPSRNGQWRPVVKCLDAEPYRPCPHGLSYH